MESNTLPKIYVQSGNKITRVNPKATWEYQKPSITLAVVIFAIMIISLGAATLAILHFGFAINIF